MNYWWYDLPVIGGKAEINDVMASRSFDNISFIN